jgi:hypothetical protein
MLNHTGDYTSVVIQKVCCGVCVEECPCKASSVYMSSVDVMDKVCGIIWCVFFQIPQRTSDQR